MGRVRWFRSKNFLMLLHYTKAVVATVWAVATQYIRNNHESKKGGASSRKKKK